MSALPEEQLPLLIVNLVPQPGSSISSLEKQRIGINPNTIHPNVLLLNPRTPRDG